jgi:hypothetical protein
MLLLSINLKQNKLKRRIAEILMIISGIGLAIGAGTLNITSLIYGGLAITSLGVISVFWR